jgi:hypothetical protein
MAVQDMQGKFLSNYGLGYRDGGEGAELLFHKAVEMQVAQALIQVGSLKPHGKIGNTFLIVHVASCARELPWIHEALQDYWHAAPQCRLQRCPGDDG